MRNNGPLTGREVSFKDGDDLVSATDTRGTITFCNEVFSSVAGFSVEELKGQPHNVVRHPEMPEAVFGMLWNNLKSGRPWMGMVKNRCKNGDHYWVDAYVTPLKSQGNVIGYESVRVKPDRAAVNRAEAAYARLNSGRSAVPPTAVWLGRLQAPVLSVTIFLLLLLAAGYFAGQLSFNYAVLAVVLGLVGGIVVALLLQREQRRALAAAHTVCRDPLAAYIYTGRADAAGEIEFALMQQKARLRTALGRFLESSGEVRQRSTAALDQSRHTHEAMVEQQQETQKVAQAMQQMSIAVQEVAAGATRTSGATSEALQQVTHSNTVLNGASDAIQGLTGTVADLGQVIERLSSDSSEIASVVDVIRGIADQTNLLALNAAIEAARAGEQGRGFAVVADEVRTLAQRTQESTEHIQKIIEKLAGATGDAATSMGACQNLAERSVEEMVNVSDALGAISNSVNTIDQMTQQIAAAAEEQSVTAIEIERNTSAITEISGRAQGQSANGAELAQDMAELAAAQCDLVERFN